MKQQQQQTLSAGGMRLTLTTTPARTSRQAVTDLYDEQREELVHKPVDMEDVPLPPDTADTPCVAVETSKPMHIQEETEQAAEAAVAARVAASGDASLNERMDNAWPASPVIGWTSPTHMERLEERHRQELAAASVPEVAVATIGELIDRLSIVNVKIYHLEDLVMESEDTETVCAAARKTRELNRERSALKNAITRAIEGAGARLDIKVGS